MYMCESSALLADKASPTLLKPRILYIYKKNKIKFRVKVETHSNNGLRVISPEMIPCISCFRVFVKRGMYLDDFFPPIIYIFIFFYLLLIICRLSYDSYIYHLQHSHFSFLNTNTWMVMSCLRWVTSVLSSLLQMQFMLLFSRQGKLRLQKWYVPLSDKERKKISRDLVQTILARKPKMCSFLEWRDLKIVYKRYEMWTLIDSLWPGSHITGGLRNLPAEWTCMYRHT